MDTPSFTNNLIHETSPYLLQHAHNPVNWEAWNPTVLNEAEKTQKLIIISIGYSACHWCHVMEEESFEDPAVADVMNQNYISIKIDREERPDIDQVYMQAVQIMTGSGGWPMNVVCLPDGRPVWGGTYFRKEQWISALQQIQKIYKEDPEQLSNYATKLSEGMQHLNLLPEPAQLEKFTQQQLITIVDQWKTHLDHKLGGTKKAPKFMMPNNLSFLLRFAHHFKDEDLKDYVLLTLDKISFGGTFDHIVGGFARYATDTAWKIPHFEKMLYDNAQLLSLYSNALKLTGEHRYKEIIEKTNSFLMTELADANGGFYAALDADSINENGKKEEGAYYTWKKEELQKLLGPEFNLFASYYNINAKGYWENGNYILYKTKTDQEFIEKEQISFSDLQHYKKEWHQKLAIERKKRAAPSLDDKIICSWNALTITGFLEAYSATNEQIYLKTAKKTATFIIEKLMADDARLCHTYKNGTSKINGYLEDYAFTIEAFIRLYEISFEEKWLKNAQKLTQYCIRYFYTENGLFQFTSSLDPSLISTPVEYTDNVMPASNSAMALNLFKLGGFFGKPEFIEIARKMLNIVLPQISSYPMGYSNWLQLYLNFSNPYYEIAITGIEAFQTRDRMLKKYLPNISISGSKNSSNLPILKDRFVKEKNLIYRCEQSKCQLPEIELTSVLNKINLV